MERDWPAGDSRRPQKLYLKGHKKNHIALNTTGQVILSLGTFFIIVIDHSLPFTFSALN